MTVEHTADETSFGVRKSIEAGLVATGFITLLSSAFFQGVQVMIAAVLLGAILTALLALGALGGSRGGGQG